jgi:hypothetical protein
MTPPIPMQPIIKPEMTPSVTIPTTATNVISPTFVCCGFKEAQRVRIFAAPHLK